MRHIAIVGSGPAGYYTAEAAVKKERTKNRTKKRKFGIFLVWNSLGAAIRGLFEHDGTYPFSIICTHSHRSERGLQTF